MARVLIGYSACPLTRRAFEAQGHDVWTCDLLPARDGALNHYQGDIWDIADGDWDFGLFHPMCTVLTCSAAWAFHDPDYSRWPEVGYHQRVKPETLTGQARRDARGLELENFRRLLALPYRKAIENPAVSYINKAIRPPDQVIQPWQFGDDASKATGLWLDGVPPLETLPFKMQAMGRMVEWPRGSGKPVLRFSNQTDSGQNNLPPGPNRWLKRSETYPGIAAAWGDQWGRYLNTMTTTEHR